MKAEQRRINASGGVLRRSLALQFLDDKQDDARAIANMKQALANPNTVAMVGLAQTNRAQAVFNAVGTEIGASGIPFLSDITVNSIYGKHANVYTIRPSQDDERVPVMAAFIKARGIERPAFVGLEDQFFSTSLAHGLKNADEVSLVADHRLAVQNNKIDPSALAAVVADLKQKDADLVVLAVGGQRTPEILAAFVAAGVTPPLFVTGRIDTIIERSGKEYPADIFQLGWDNLPDIFCDRLRDRIVRNGLEQWMFEGTKVSEAPGWKRVNARHDPKAACPTCSTAAT